MVRLHSSCPDTSGEGGREDASCRVESSLLPLPSHRRRQVTEKESREKKGRERTLEETQGWEAIARKRREGQLTRETTNEEGRKENKKKIKNRKKFEKKNQKQNLKINARISSVI